MRTPAAPHAISITGTRYSLRGANPNLGASDNRLGSVFAQSADISGTVTAPAIGDGTDSRIVIDTVGGVWATNGITLNSTGQFIGPHTGRHILVKTNEIGFKDGSNDQMLRLNPSEARFNYYSKAFKYTFNTLGKTALDIDGTTGDAVFAGVVSLRNSTAPTELLLHETYTDVDNYGRLRIYAQTGGAYVIGSEAAGTGVAQNIRVDTNLFQVQSPVNSYYVRMTPGNREILLSGGTGTWTFTTGHTSSHIHFSRTVAFNALINSVLEPQNPYSIGTSSRRWGTVYAEAGDFSGTVTVGNGSLSSPSLVVGVGGGLYSNSDDLDLRAVGSISLRPTAASNGQKITFSVNSLAFNATGNPVVFSSGNNAFEQRNSTNPQSWAFYESYTNETNYGRLRIYTQTGGDHVIASEAAGTGVARRISLVGNVSVLRDTTTADLIVASSTGGANTGHGGAIILTAKDDSYGYAGGAKILSRQRLGAGNVDSHLVLQTWDGAWLDRIFVQYDGNVGIGTSDPSTRLHVSDGTLRLSNTANTSYAELSGGGGYLNVKPTIANQYGLLLREYDSNSWFGFGVRDGYAQLVADSGLDYSINKNNSAAKIVIIEGAAPVGSLHLDGTGRFGVGTITPLYKLDVAGSLALRNSTTPTELLLHETYTNADNYGRLRIYAQTGGDYVIASEAAGTGIVRDITFTGGNLTTLRAGYTNNVLFGAGVAPSLASSNNTIIGDGAGTNVTTVGSTVLIGRLANAKLAANYSLVAIGASAVASIFGVAVGTNAVSGGQGVVSIGYDTGSSSTSGSYGINIGQQAGKAVTTGTRNILVGVTANVSTGTLSDSKVLCGYGLATDSNQFIGGSNNSPTHNIYFGNGVTNATPVAYTIHGTGGEGTDIAGASITIAGGKGTGNALGGPILFQTSDAGVSGSTLQSLTTKMTLTTAGDLEVTGGGNFSSTVTAGTLNAPIVTAGSYRPQSGDYIDFRSASGLAARFRRTGVTSYQYSGGGHLLFAMGTSSFGDPLTCYKTINPANTQSLGEIGSEWTQLYAKNVTLQNSTTPTELLIHNTYIDADNYERLKIYGQTGGDYVIASEATGTGTVRNIAFLGAAKIGVGLTNPISLLSNTASNLSALSSGLSWEATGEGYVASFRNPGGSTGCNGVLITGHAGSGSYLLNAQTSGTPTSRFSVKGNGYVGINVSVPTYTFQAVSVDDVSSSGGYSKIALFEGADTAGNTVTSVLELKAFRSATENLRHFAMQSWANRSLIGTTARNLVLQPSGGNVLIGTTTDDGVNKLQVAGGATFSGTVTTGPDAANNFTTSVAANGDTTLSVMGTSGGFFLNINGTRSLGLPSANSFCSVSLGRGAASVAGQEIVAIGFEAGMNANSLSDNSVYIGYRAGRDAVNGSWNNFIGWGAGKDHTGDQNIFLGGQASGLTTTDNNSIVIGHTATGAGSNSVVLGNTAVTATVLRGNVSTNGNFTLQNSTTPTELLLHETYTNETNYGRLRIYAQTGAAYVITSEAAGTGVVRDIALMGGKVGVGTTSPDAKWQINVPNITGTFEGTVIGGSTVAQTGSNVAIITTTPQGTGVGGMLALGGMRDGGSSSPGIFGAIRGGKENSIGGNTAGSLGFYTLESGVSLNEKMRITSIGNVGIGLAGPTAYLHLKAGTAAANTAPLKFTSGVVTGTPEPGAMEFANQTLWFTAANVRRAVNLSNGVITGTTTVANTVTETTIYTEPIAADELHTGQVVRVRALGRYSTANGSDTATIRLKIGGVEVLTVVTTAANVTDAPFDIEFVCTVRSDGVTGTVFAFAKAEFNNESKTVTDATPTTLDTTVAEDITLTVEHAVADVNNSMSVDQGFTTFIQ